MRRVVVLPQPLGPSRVMNSPDWTVSDTPSTALTPPGNVLVTCTKSTRLTPTLTSPAAADKGAGLLRARPSARLRECCDAAGSPLPGHYACTLVTISSCQRSLIQSSQSR